MTKETLVSTTIKFQARKSIKLLTFQAIVRDKAHGFSSGIIDRTGAQTMLYLTCTMISIVELAHYGVSRAKYWVSVDCVTKFYCRYA